MIYLAAVLGALLVLQQILHAGERRRLVDRIVARHAPDVAMLERKPGRARKVDKKPEPKMSNRID